MDSPLLPTQRYRPFHSTSNAADDPSLLADLSIEDDDMGGDESFASSPPRPISRTQQYPQPRQASASSSRSASNSSSGFRRQVSISSRAGESDGDDTPQKPTSGPAAGGRGTSKPRFSLFAPPRPPSAEIPSSHGGRDSSVEQDEEQEEGDSRAEEEGEEDGEDQTIHASAGPSRTAHTSAADRDDKLRESLYELRRMNEVFEGFLGALEASRGHNERLAVRVKQTSALLDEYTAFLGQAEHTQKLLSNPNWTGAHDDAAAIEAEHLAQLQAEQQRQRVAEEAAEAAQRAEEEKERRLADAERAKESGRGGVPGRGRGGARGGTVRGRGSGIPTSTRTSGAKTATAGIRKPTAPTVTTGGSGGTGTGKYGYVASSGYGPPGRK